MAKRIHWRFWERGRTGCAAIEPLLSLYADQMASPTEARRVEAHLHDCADCRRALQWMQATRQVIVSRPVAAPPPELRARIARAIAELEAAKAPAPPARRPLTLRPALAYGASFALLAAVAGGIIWDAGNHPTVVAVGPKSNPPVVIGTEPAHGPASLPLPVKGPRTVTPSSPRIAHKDLRPSLPVVHRRAAAPLAAPDLMASVGGGANPVPPRLSLVKTTPHLKPTHRASPIPGPLLAKMPPSVASPLPRLKPVYVHAAPVPHEDVHVAERPAPATLPNAPVPDVRVQTPVVTTDEGRPALVAASPSVNDTLSHIAVSFQQGARLTTRSFAANSRTVADNFAVATADSSGTANITEGPVR
jgi:hypothetical protein